MTQFPISEPMPRTRRLPLFRAGVSGKPIDPLNGVGRRTLRIVRSVRRGMLIALWTPPMMLIQSVLLRLPGRGKAHFARFYWASVARLLGMQIRVVGQVARPAPGRTVVFACNHSSWLDILVIGGTLEGCFVAKGEVAGWPVVSLIASLGRTIFVSRVRENVGRERDTMARRLAGGDNLILFPEGTSSDGCRVLPFRSTFFSVAEGVGQANPPLIQPVSVVYDRLAGLPTGRASRPVFAWYGDMDLGSHFWRLAQWRGMRATVLLHTPIDPGATGCHPALNRKQIAHMSWVAVAEGAAALRQNRPARPMGETAPPAGSTQPAFA